MAGNLQTIRSVRARSLGIFIFVISTVSAGQIPRIPAGHRTQYLLLRPDGGYSSGYDTGIGQVEIAEGNAANEVRGAYAGGPLRVHYTAGVGGYIPTVEVITPPTPLYASPPPSQSPPSPPTSPPPPPLINQTPLFIPQPLPFPAYFRPEPRTKTPVGIETADTQVVHNPDGSYSFSYRTSDQSRQESADAKNNVKGSFSFIPPDDGVRRTVNYQVGADTGFVAQGAHLPTPPPQPPVTEQTPPTTDTEGSQTDDDENTPTPPTDDGSGSINNVNSDASYAFAYRTPDQERIETSDSVGNVRGLFAFVAPDGIRRRVDYEAGANRGFIAKGDHLPTPPTDINVGGLQDGQGPPRVVTLTPIMEVPLVPANTYVLPSGSWPVGLTVPDPKRVDADLGNFVVRNYLPSHPRKAGYVLDIKH